MAKTQENPPVFTATYTPITEPVQQGFDGYEEAGDASAGCGCFRRLCFRWDYGEGHSYLLQERSGLHKETWLVDKFKKLKQFTELVAGPKWKNFIRKLGRCCNPRKYDKQTRQFQYSPESYALNFAGDEEQENDADLMHSFSSRFAPHSLINDQQRRAGL